VQGFRRAVTLAVERLKAIAVAFDDDPVARRGLLEKCAKTSLNSKLIARYQDFFAPMIVDAVECLGESLDLSLIGIKKVPGGSVTECALIKGVAFKRTFSYAGFEQQVCEIEVSKLSYILICTHLLGAAEEVCQPEDPCAVFGARTQK
jgi:T-complex protein 1 subunit eta